MFTNSNLKAEEKLIHDLSKIIYKPRNIESSISIHLDTEQEHKKALHKQQNIIAWMSGQIKNKNQEHIIGRSINNPSLDSISVDFQEKQELEIGAKLQPHPSLKVVGYIITKPQTQASRNSNNTIIYFQGKSTTVALEALVRAITLQK